MESVLCFCFLPEGEKYVPVKSLTVLNVFVKNICTKGTSSEAEACSILSMLLQLEVSGGFHCPLIQRLLLVLL